MNSFASSLALFLCVTELTQAQTYTCGSVDTSADNDMSVALRFDDASSMVYITMTGPSGQFFGAGFGASNMQTDGTYAIIVDTNGVTERALGARSAGTQISPSSLTLESDETVDDVRTILVSRAINGSEYSFDSDASSLSLIWAQSSSSTFTQHGDLSTDRGSATLSISTGIAADDASCGEAIPEDASTTYMPQDDTATTTEAASYICGTVETRSSDDMAVFLRIDEENSMVYISMTGPDDQWFGAGFGATVMNGAYVIIIDDSGVTERELAARGPGTELTASVTTVSDESSGGIRTVLLSRELDGDDDSYYTFGTSGSISLIYGTTSGAASFEQHSSRGTASITLASGYQADASACGEAIPEDTDDDGDDDDDDDVASTLMNTRVACVICMLSGFFAANF